MAHYRLAFMDGQFPPRWASNFNFGYGSPIFNFFYPLSSAIGASLSFLGFSLETVYKIILLISFLLAPIFFYLWLAPKNRFGAFIGALFYGLAPYHFLDLYVRGNSGETLAFVWLPLVFLAIDRYFKLTFIFYGLLILTHNILGLMFSPIIFLYAAVTRPKALFGLVIGLALTAFFWLPAIVESKYLNSVIFTKNIFTGNFPIFSQLISSPWGFGPEVTKIGGLSPQIGWFQTLVVIVSLFFVFRRKNFFGIFGLLSFAIGLFFSLSISMFFWQHFPLLSNFQFPWRFTALSSFGVAILAFYLCQQVGKFLPIIFLLGLFFSSWPKMQIIPTFSRPDSFYFSYNQAPDYHGESATIWAAGYPDKPPIYSVQIISGKAEIFNLIRQSLLHTYKLKVYAPSEVLDNTIYFPGWRVFVDGIDTPVQFQNQMYPGFIIFPVSAGDHTIKVIFTKTAVHKIADIISLATFLGIIVISVWRKK